MQTVEAFTDKFDWALAKKIQSYAKEHHKKIISISYEIKDVKCGFTYCALVVFK